MVSLPFSVIKLNTTGLNSDLDKIIEISLLKVRHGIITEEFHSFVHYDGKLSLEAKKTGLSEQLLRTAPSWTHVKEQVYEFLSNEKVLVGHNVSFDKSFLESHEIPLQCSYLDTVRLSEIFFPEIGSYTLDNVAGNLLDKDSQNASSVKIVLEVFKIIINKALNLEASVTRKVERIIPTHWDEKAFFQSIIDQNIFKVETMAINETIKLPTAPSTSSELTFDLETLSILFSKEHGIGKVLPDYEKRPQQFKMSSEVLSALEAPNHLVVEAGTGTGKTLAYLAPAALLSLTGGERVVVSTNTINLQQQLWEKDIPILKKILPKEFKAVILKGRSNYLCLRKWANFISNIDSWSDWTSLFALKVLIWEAKTITGDKSKLNLKRTMDKLWFQICSEGDTCWGSQCSWFNSCYVTKAKQKALGANIIVANHSLVLADVLSGHKVIPDYGHLIVDEAQHFEETAAKQARTNIFYFQLLELAESLINLKVPVQFNVVFSQDVINAIRNVGKYFKTDLENFLLAGNQLLDLLKQDTVRINEEVSQRSQWQDLILQIKTIIDRLALAKADLTALIEQIEEQDFVNEIWNNQLLELETKISMLLRDLYEILDWQNPDCVTWVEGGKEKSFIVNRQPIKVGPILAERFYPNFKTIIFTSATITVNDRFIFFENSLSLTELSPVYYQVTSPFSYENQSMICIPNNLPKINSMDYLNKSASLVIDIVSALEGGTLVLFNSHQMLQECYYRVKPILSSLDIKILGQGIDGDRWQLVDTMKRNNNTVVFGAQSFWEGVDVPGDNLRCVIIMRLPFVPPVEPTMAARLEQLEKDNKNSFYHLSLPLAILRFKQGAGRLIRTERDKGVIIVMDNRIITQRYGKYFLSSLPNYRYCKLRAEDVVEKIQSFIIK